MRGAVQGRGCMGSVHEKMLGMRSQLSWHSESAGSGERSTSPMSPSPALVHPLLLHPGEGGRGQQANTARWDRPTLFSPAPRNRQVCFSSFSCKMLRARGSFRKRNREQGIPAQTPSWMSQQRQPGIHWAQDHHGHPST